MMNFTGGNSIMLSNDDLRTKAPSIFAESPFQDRSDKYRFVPTIKVVDALRDNGFVPVKADQSRCRLSNKKDYTRHVVRFRRKEDNDTVQVNAETPEIVLLNSHDGTSSYQMYMGLFRLVCANGLIVSSAQFDAIKVRHQGAGDLPSQIIQASFEMINSAPKIFNDVKRWKDIDLNREQQQIYASSALQLSPSTIEVMPDQILRPRRFEDQGSVENGGRSLWHTFNVIQENMIKGGVSGRSATNRIRRTRQIKSVNSDTKLNKALWTLTERMGQLSEHDDYLEKKYNN